MGSIPSGFLHVRPKFKIEVNPSSVPDSRAKVTPIPVLLLRWAQKDIKSVPKLIQPVDKQYRAHINPNREAGFASVSVFLSLALRRSLCFLGTSPPAQ